MGDSLGGRESQRGKPAQYEKVVAKRSQQSGRGSHSQERKEKKDGWCTKRGNFCF